MKKKKVIIISILFFLILGLVFFLFFVSNKNKSDNIKTNITITPIFFIKKYHPLVVLFPLFGYLYNYIKQQNY